MEENTFWVKQLKTIVIGFLAFVALLIGSCQTTKFRITQAIEAGAHPYLAECALTDIICDELLVIEIEKLR